MLVYIAGKMRGKPYYNFPAFDLKQKELEALGHRVISPANLDRAYGFDPFKGDSAEAGSDFDMKAAVRRDVEALLQCEALILLEGWETSVGATGEVSIAKWVGIPVYYPGDLVPPARLAENGTASVK